MSDIFLENPGYCVICEKSTVFRSEYSWLRDHYRCAGCGTIPRQRALVYVLNLLIPDWRSKAIHESSPSMGFFAAQAQNYSGSFYFPERQPGSVQDGQRCENLESLTFSDQTFDIVITQDVMEHVFSPQAAFQEIMRVLKRGGTHVFSTPVHRDRISEPRAAMSDGNIEHLKEPQFHGNPISAEGSLVTWDYGTDFLARASRWAGYQTSSMEFHDRDLGIDAEFIEVYVCRKSIANKLTE